MKKMLIIGLALSFVLVSGAFFSAQAQCGCLNLSWLNPCNWHWPSCCCASAAVAPVAPRDTDNPQPNCLSKLSPCNWHMPSCGCR